MTLEQREDIARRLAAAIRSGSLYSADHPLLARSVEALATCCRRSLVEADHVVVGFIDDDVVVDGMRLGRARAALQGFVRDLREREIEKITLVKGVSADELRTFIMTVNDRSSQTPLEARLTARGVRHVTVGRIVVDEPDEAAVGMVAARRVYGVAVKTAEQLWGAAQAGEQPDPRAARQLIENLARFVDHDRSPIMALTAARRHDSYTFTHMVNVSALAMAQAKSLSLDAATLHEFGFAALMHDIGKVHTPLEILNKPDQLSPSEFTVMKRHVIDGAHILRKTPETPALAPIVAFEHHLKQDLSGYPENVGHRTLNLCTMIVSIADVFDALRSNRIYRQGLSTERVRALMSQQDSPAFNQKLLRRFINLVGLFPIGTLVRLDTEEIGVVTHEHPTDPFRPQVKVMMDKEGNRLETPFLVNTWERDAQGDAPRSVIEAIDPQPMGIDPLALLNE